ncbi:MAG: DUF4215 domain-containing protein [Myxococcota bacterium]
MVTTSSSLGGCFTTRDDGDTGLGVIDEDASGGPADYPGDGDDGGESAADGMAGPVCGDGVVDDGEQCDDGNDVNEDACKADCTTNVCGDGFVDPATEECDDANAEDGDGCLTGCVLNVCGDGVVDPATEECDDGNSVMTDSCPVDCRWNTCGDGLIWVGAEDCDHGADNGPNGGCLSDCTLNVCGDGNVCTGDDCISGPGNGPEECDDANDQMQDDCLNDCTAATCGDGVLQMGIETCDGTNVAGATCTSLGYSGGQLACVEGGCQLDESACCNGWDAPCVDDSDCCDPYSCYSDGGSSYCTYI